MSHKGFDRLLLFQVMGIFLRCESPGGWETQVALGAPRARRELRLRSVVWPTFPADTIPTMGTAKPLNRIQRLRSKADEHLFLMEDGPMTMQPISVERAIELAKRQGLQAGIVRGTEHIQFTNGKNQRIEVIDWDTFRDLLEKRKLQVHESGRWLKVMQASKKP